MGPVIRNKGYSSSVWLNTLSMKGILDALETRLLYDIQETSKDFGPKSWLKSLILNWKGDQPSYKQGPSIECHNGLGNWWGWAYNPPIWQ